MYMNAVMMKGENKMETYDIPCTWQMFGTQHNKANNLRESIRMAEGNQPLPSDRGYINDSFQVEDIDTIYEANGMEIPTLSEGQIREELDKRTDPRVEFTSCFDPQTANYSIDELIGILRDYYDEDYIF